MALVYYCANAYFHSVIGHQSYLLGQFNSTGQESWKLCRFFRVCFLPESYKYAKSTLQAECFNLILKYFIITIFVCDYYQMAACYSFPPKFFE
jgi:hypothetical protein